MVIRAIASEALTGRRAVFGRGASLAGGAGVDGASGATAGSASVSRLADALDAARGSAEAALLEGASRSSAAGFDRSLDRYRRALSLMSRSPQSGSRLEGLSVERLTDATRVSGQQLRLEQLERGELVVNGYAVRSVRSGGADAIAAAINELSSSSGVEARVVDRVQSLGRVGAAQIRAGQLRVNGVDVVGGELLEVEALDRSGALVRAINAVTDQTGVTASIEDGELWLMAATGRSIEVQNDVSATAAGTETRSVTTTTTTATTTTVANPLAPSNPTSVLEAGATLETVASVEATADPVHAVASTSTFTPGVGAITVTIDRGAGTQVVTNVPLGLNVGLVGDDLSITGDTQGLDLVVEYIGDGSTDANIYIDTVGGGALGLDVSAMGDASIDVRKNDDGDLDGLADGGDIYVTFDGEESDIAVRTPGAIVVDATASAADNDITIYQTGSNASGEVEVRSDSAGGIDTIYVEAEGDGVDAHLRSRYADLDIAQSGGSGAVNVDSASHDNDIDISTSSGAVSVVATSSGLDSDVSVTQTSGSGGVSIANRSASGQGDIDVTADGGDIRVAATGDDAFVTISDTSVAGAVDVNLDVGEADVVVTTAGSIDVDAASTAGNTNVTLTQSGAGGVGAVAITTSGTSGTNLIRVLASDGADIDIDDSAYVSNIQVDNEGGAVDVVASARDVDVTIGTSGAADVDAGASSGDSDVAITQDAGASGDITVTTRSSGGVDDVDITATGGSVGVDVDSNEVDVVVDNTAASGESLAVTVRGGDVDLDLRSSGEMQVDSTATVYDTNLLLVQTGASGAADVDVRTSGTASRELIDITADGSSVTVNTTGREAGISIDNSATAGASVEVSSTVEEGTIDIVTKGAVRVDATASDDDTNVTVTQTGAGADGDIHILTDSEGLEDDITVTSEGGDVYLGIDADDINLAVSASGGSVDADLIAADDLDATITAAGDIDLQRSVADNIDETLSAGGTVTTGTSAVISAPSFTSTADDNLSGIPDTVTNTTYSTTTTTAQVLIQRAAMSFLAEARASLLEERAALELYRADGLIELSGTNRDRVGLGDDVLEEKHGLAAERVGDEIDAQRALLALTEADRALASARSQALRSELVARAAQAREDRASALGRLAQPVARLATVNEVLSFAGMRSLGSLV